jgi:hypothetical protein
MVIDVALRRESTFSYPRSHPDTFNVALEKRDLSPKEEKRLDRLRKTRENARGRKTPATVPIRLTRTSAFAPRNRDLITDSNFRRRYVVPHHSVIEVSGRELGTQHRDALYALFRLPRTKFRRRNPDVPSNVTITGKPSHIDCYEVNTTWRHLLEVQGRQHHVNNLLTLIRTFEDMKKVVVTVYEGIPEKILPLLERKNQRGDDAGAGGMGNIIGDISWDGLNLDSNVRVEFGTWVFKALEQSKLISLNADVQFRLRSGYAKSFWPYIDGFTTFTYVDEDMLGHLVGRDLNADGETKNTRGQFRRDCKEAFDDMVKAGGLKNWHTTDIGIGRIKKRRYFYVHALPRQGELAFDLAAHSLEYISE